MLANRLKIFLLLLVLLFLSVLFWQNRELLSLKVLCPDVNQSCLYQTPPLPLAIWMFVFTLAGVVTSLIWQLLNYLSAKGARKKKSSSSSSSTRYVSERDTLPKGSPTETNTQPSNQSRQSTGRSSVETRTKVDPISANNSNRQSDWEEDSRDDDWHTEEPTPAKTKQNPKIPKNTEKTQSSDTTYSYKSRPDDDSEDQKVDRVYDANYRVINPSLRKTNNETRKDDDDEWI